MQESKSLMKKKPGSNYQDTFRINKNSAVFYHPDSFQLDSIRLLTDPRIFDGSMHEYFYQIKNAKRILKENWKNLDVINLKNIRYIAFQRADGITEYIDLDKYYDAYGLFLFKVEKSPVPADMTNVEEALYFYFSQ